MSGPISFVDWLVLALAVFRLVRLIMIDRIFAAWRAWFLQIEETVDETGQSWEQIHIRGSGWRYAVGYLLTCHWCLGIWLAGLCVGLYLFLPAAQPLLVVLSLAGASSLLHSWLENKT